ncbi:PQQ-binding-like beta-propeller repeat protein [Natrinema thermotolerans]|uniref:PQQ-binding-like beta-propeller repeat protein n=1 Tax=Natrinema thermotolerans TaxID=121872 RepID=UPI0030842CA9
MVSSVAVMPLLGGLDGGTAEATNNALTTPSSISTVQSSTTAGEANWTYTTGDTVRSSPTIVNGTAFVGSYDSNLYAVDADTGNKEWNFSTGSGIWESSPVVSNGTVYIGSSDNNLYAVDADTGQEQWSYSTGWYIAGSPTVEDGTVYVGSRDQKVHAIDASTGEQEWNFTTGGEIYASTAVNDGTVYVGTTDNKLYALDADTGEQQWTYTTGGVIESAATVWEGTVYFGSKDNDLYALDADTGEKVWNYTTGDSITDSSPTVSEGTVYVGSYDNRVHAVDGVTGSEQWSYQTGADIDSSPTVSNGVVYVGSDDSNLYALDAEAGSEKWTYTAGGGIGSSPTVAAGTVYVGSADNSLHAVTTDHSSSSSGTRVQQETLGHLGPSYVSSGSQITGVVEDQEGNPVSSASVSAWGPNPPAFDESSLDNLNDTIDDLEQQVENPLPSEYDDFASDFGVDNGLVDAESFANGIDGTYPLVHQENDWGSGTTTILSSEVDDPRLSVDSDSTVVLSLWDASEQSGFFDPAGPVDGSHPGAVTEGTIVVEQLDPAGGEIDRTTYETSPVFETSTSVSEGWGGEEYHAVRTNLQQGVYRAYPEGNQGAAYTFTVGEPDQLADSIVNDFEDRIVSLEGREERLSALLNDDRIVRKTARTDENGRFSISMPSGVETANVHALKGNGEILQNVSDPSLDDLRDAQRGDYNGSFYIPNPRPATVEPPAENVTVTTFRSPQLPYGDMSSFADLQQWLQQQRLNETIGELQTEYEQRFADMERQSLERVYQNHRTLVETVPNAEARYVERSEFDSVQDAGDLSDGELETETRHMQLALANVGEIEAPEVPDDAVSVDDGELNLEYPLPDNVDPDTVAPELHWSDGTVEQIPDDAYSVESRGALGQNQVLVINGLPIDSSDPAAFDVRVQAASGGDDGLLGDGGDGGVLDDRVSATNPAFDGLVPEINAVDFSTLAPGDGERVAVDLDPAEGSGYDRIVDATAYGPSGEPINATVDTERDQAAFTTADTGVHYVQLVYQNDQGNQFTISERIRALEEPRSDPATIRTSQAPTGTYAVIGEQLESARVETGERGTTTFTAVKPADEPVSKLAIKPGETVQTASHTFDIQVVEGSDETAANSHVSVAIHLDSYPETAIAWRNGAPITQDGQTRYGQVDRPDDAEAGGKGVLRTYTDASGQATVQLHTSPGPLQEFDHWAAYSVPLPDIPFLSIFGGGSALVAGIGLMWTRRRRSGERDS